MKLLAIDTATEACSAALYLDGEVAQRYELAPQGHAERILPMVEALLAEAGLALGQLDALGFGCGPGSFTGVRIGTGVVQGLAFAAQRPVLPISSLAALAQGAVRELGAGRVLAAIDARMQEIYWGVFSADAEGRVAAQGEERVIAPAALEAVEGTDWYGVGSGWLSYAAPLEERFAGQLARVEGERYPQAHDVAVLAAAAFERGEAVAAEQALPRYLRDQVASKPGA